jgi:dihydroneopterin aldolase
MIEIKGIKGYGYHGVFANEREIGQEFFVDVAADLDLTAAAQSDDLADSVDYGAMAKSVLAEITGQPCNLIEKLASRIGQRLITEFSKLDSVTITVHKPSAPLGVNAEDVSVTITTWR